MRTLLIAAILSAVFVLGCGSNSGEANSNSTGGDEFSLDLAVPLELQDLLEEPDSAIFYTLAEEHETQGSRAADLKGLDLANLPKLRGYYVLGQVELSDAETSLLVGTFKEAFFQGSKAGVGCFWPHHAIVLKKGDRTLEIFICFMCMNYMIKPDGGYNNVVLKTRPGMEDTWRSIVSKHGLRDISEKEK